MEDLFRNNPKFAALSEEAKARVLKKFHSLSPDAQTLVYKKLGAKATGPDMKQLIAEDLPVQPASVLSDIQRGAKQGLGAIATMATGVGLNEASNVAQGKPTTTIRGKIGEVVGDAVSPAGMAMGAGIKAGVRALGPVAKAMKPGYRAEVGKAIGEADQAAIQLENKAAGIVGPKVQKIATAKSLGEDLGIPTSQRNLVGITNSLAERLEAGKKLPVKQLVEYRQLVNDAFRNEKLDPSSSSGALISKLNKQVGDILNKSVKGRAALASEYSRVKKIQAVLQNLAKGAAGAGLAGGAIAGGKALFGR